jgi:hypothetical protein
MSKDVNRDNFRKTCLERDGYKCIICGKTEELAIHHILERRLWDDGGYHTQNGATLCPECHILAEQTLISCEELREAAGITEIVLPEFMYRDNDFKYDKWGNIILANGTRLKGELFFDESVQKILKEGDVLHLFMDYIKYSRTFHAPWSNPSKDDKVMHDISHFYGQEVVVTEKIDGENTSCYADMVHARSLEPVSGEDHAFVKIIQARISADLPQGWRVCGENVYAQHSIKYENLDTYFYVFGIWDNINTCLSWDETVEWCELLNLRTAPVLYRGIYDEEKIKSLWDESKRDIMEGYVIRTVKSFSFGEFRKWMMKFVRSKHVTTETHWRHQKIIPNKLKKDAEIW